MAIFSDKTVINNALLKEISCNAMMIQVDNETYWIPKSEIHDDSEIHNVGDTGTIIVATPFWNNKNSGAS